MLLPTIATTTTITTAAAVLHRVLVMMKMMAMKVSFFWIVCVLDFFWCLGDGGGLVNHHLDYHHRCGGVVNEESVTWRTFGW